MAACRLKAKRFSLSVLEVAEPDRDRLEDQLAKLVRSGGTFMRNAPVVLDISAIESQGPEAALAVKEAVASQQLVPCGLIASDAFFDEHGDVLGLTQMAREPGASSCPENDHWAAAQVVDHPVRSGQQIYARGRDLIILSSVSDGAEVIADGSVHVYGPLRGRAIAGATGLEAARIFSQCFHAELLAIAGQYRVLEEQPDELVGRPVQAWLEQDRLKVEPLWT